MTLSGTLPELTEPYFRYSESTLEDWKANAKSFYGRRSSMAPLRQSANGPSCENTPYLIRTAGVGWIAQLFVDYWLFTGGRKFLVERAISFLKIEWDNPRNYLVIRGGRFEMSLGAGRLVATRAAPNIPFKFDGLQLIGAGYDSKMYAFITKPAREQKYGFDDEYPGQLFWGVYLTTPTLFKPAHLKADLYYLGYKNDEANYATGNGSEERHTFGTRLFGDADGLDFDIEPILQTGEFASEEILVWTVGSSVGYRFENIAAHPRIGTEFDVVSGDTRDNQNEGKFGSFNPLFFKAGYFNDASLIRPSNIIDIHPRLQLLPTKNIEIVLGSDVLWRYTTADGVPGPPGNTELPAGADSRYIATTAELSVQWQIDRHLTWINSSTHFFVGDAVNHQHGGDVDFLGSWLTYTW